MVHKRAEDFELTKEQIQLLLGRMDYLRYRYYSNEGINVSYQELVSAVRLIAEYVEIPNPKIELVSNNSELEELINLIESRNYNLADIEIQKHYSKNRIYDKTQNSLCIEIVDNTIFNNNKVYFRDSYNSPIKSYFVCGDFLQIFRDCQHQTSKENFLCEDASLLKILFERSDFRHNFNFQVFGEIDPDNKQVQNNEVIQFLNFLYCNYENYDENNFNNAIWLYEALRSLDFTLSAEVNSILDAALTLQQANVFILVNTEEQISIYLTNTKDPKNNPKNFKNTALINGNKLQFYTNKIWLFRDGFVISAHKYSELIQSESYQKMVDDNIQWSAAMESRNHICEQWIEIDDTGFTPEFSNLFKDRSYSKDTLNFTLENIHQKDFYALLEIEMHSPFYKKIITAEEASSIRDSTKRINCSLLRIICSPIFYNTQTNEDYNYGIIQVDEEAPLTWDDIPVDVTWDIDYGL